jgi:hypothetical protein
MKKLLPLTIFIILIISIITVTSGDYKSDIAYKPKEGFVPNKETAIKIAEAIWLPIYGDRIYKRKPFVAELKNGKTWIVQGTLPKGWDGGTPYIEIQKSDGKILLVMHGK